MNQNLDSLLTEYCGRKFYLPDYKNSVIGIKNSILEGLNDNRKMIIFGFDSVNTIQFKRHFGGKIDLSDMKELSSVFPTGSPTSFSSIFFGNQINQHGIFGIAFYCPKEKGIYQTSKDCIVNTMNETLRDAKFQIHGQSFLSEVDIPVFYIHVNHFWYSSNLWSKFSKSTNHISVHPRGHYKSDYNRQLDLDAVLDNTEELLNKSKNDKLVYVSVDFDEHMHREGVETDITQKLLSHVSNRICDIIYSNPEYDYVFLSDHGQIDLKNNYPFDFEKIVKYCYSHRGGLGRTSYFYSNKDIAFDIIEEQVGDTGIVLKKNNPLLKKIFGFDPVIYPEIGDIIAFATEPSFPSYGWSSKAEHGALAKEELFVPYLHLKSQKKNI